MAYKLIIVWPKNWKAPVRRRARALPVRRRARALWCILSLALKGWGQPPGALFFKSWNLKKRSILNNFPLMERPKIILKIYLYFFLISRIASNSAHNSWGPNCWLLLTKTNYVCFFLTQISRSGPNYHWLIKEGIEKKSTLRINSSRLPPFILCFI